MSPTCTTCRFLVKTGGYSGRTAERSCCKCKFTYVPAATWQPITNCSCYEPKQQKARSYH